MRYNRLQNEKSPYLLQHAQNPVDWYPWGEEAFEKARCEDKPVFLSIGYSTCHWCHVMERESFEDADVAKLLNDTFINIKVDREERPDIDAVYMKACQIMTKSGGWPLTLMMTPDKKPFFAATYLPRETKYSRRGLLEMIPEVQTLWQAKRADIISAASEIYAVLQQPTVSHPGEVGEETLHRAYRSLWMSYDKTYGGFGQSPKFPTPHHFFFLLRYWKRTGDAQALQMVEHSLQNMRRGGIYDQIGFGFHRYSTDVQWILPHFEKMLYDQALMAMAYTEIYQATGKKEYEIIVREILTYVLRDMTDAGGGFYCAEDADSEGVEGKFYLWSENEIRSVLTQEEADLFLSDYRHASDSSAQDMQAIPAGHFIPHLQPLSAVDTEGGLLAHSGKMEVIRKKLFAVREKRVRPHKDDKILADWNGLMITALARAAQVFDDKAYAEAAIRAMDFITQSLQTKEGRLLHRYRDGQGSIAANIDDYSFMIWALLELYETTFHVRHLIKALEYQSHLTAYFRDDVNGGFFFTPHDAETLLIRPKELYDGAIPSGNSVAFLNILRLSRMTGDVELDERAHEIYRAFCESADAMPTAHTHFLCGLDFAIGPACEVVIVGNRDRLDTQALWKALRNRYVPNKIAVFRPEHADQPDIEAIAPYVQSYSSINDQATAYVCSNFTCSQPTNDPEQMMALLNLLRQNYN